MPLLRYRDLDSWERLVREDIEITEQIADTSPLQIGFLNMMPDRALKATERQFYRLLAAGAEDIVVQIHPFSIEGLPRSVNALDYVSKAYVSFDEITNIKLDGLVLTGANPGKFEITAEKFWPYFEEVVHWANEKVPTILCSCLASHAILKIFHGIERIRCQPDKRWGVFSHRLTQSKHPLMADMPEQYEEPRSHVFEMTAEQMEPHGVQVLASSSDADFGIAVSEDGGRWVFLQGHPEYDSVSLLKEYKREINRFRLGERSNYPDYPLNYLPDSAKQNLEKYRADFLLALEQDLDLPELPESEILPLIDNTWRAHAELLYRNWIRMVVNKKEKQKSNAVGVDSC